jgi:hypothetical protein
MMHSDGAREGTEEKRPRSRIERERERERGEKVGRD